MSDGSERVTQLRIKAPPLHCTHLELSERPPSDQIGDAKFGLALHLRPHKCEHLVPVRRCHGRVAGLNEEREVGLEGLNGTQGLQQEAQEGGRTGIGWEDRQRLSEGAAIQPLQ